MLVTLQSIPLGLAMIKCGLLSPSILILPLMMVLSFEMISLIMILAGFSVELLISIPGLETLNFSYIL